RDQLERDAHTDLAEVARAVRACEGEDGAGVPGGMRVLDERPQGEPESRREGDGHPRPEQQPSLAHAVYAVRLRPIGFVTRSIEANHVQAGGAELDVVDGRKGGLAELTGR